MTATHKETTAVHPLSAAVDTARTHYEISAPQAVDPVSVGTPSQPQQPAIGLPSTGLFHPGQESTGLRGAVGGSNGGIDPSKTGSNAETSLDDMASAIGACAAPCWTPSTPTRITTRAKPAPRTI